MYSVCHYCVLKPFAYLVLPTKIESADACLILANKYCADPDAEDASNIMRYNVLCKVKSV